MNINVNYFLQDWFEARQFCKGKGMDLASIGTKKIHKYVLEEIQQFGNIWGDKY